MTAPSKSFTAITDGQVDGGSPVNETLTEAIRDNLVHLEEWLGHSYTAAQDHDHDGTNSKAVPAAAISGLSTKLVGATGSYTGDGTSRTITTGLAAACLFYVLRNAGTGTVWIFAKTDATVGNCPVIEIDDGGTADCAAQSSSHGVNGANFNVANSAVISAVVDNTNSVAYYWLAIGY